MKDIIYNKAFEKVRKDGRYWLISMDGCSCIIVAGNRRRNLCRISFSLKLHNYKIIIQNICFMLICYYQSNEFDNFC